MLTLIATTAFGSIVSGLCLSSIIEKIGEQIEKRKGRLDRLYAAQRQWAEANDAAEMDAIAYLYIRDRNRAA